MIKTEIFYIYRTDSKLSIRTRPVAWKDLDERAKALFFDAQHDIDLAGLDIAVLEEDAAYREELEKFMNYMESSEDSEGALMELGLDDIKINFVLSGETIIGYVLPDVNDADITYAASFLPIPALSDILCGVPAKQLSPLPLLRNRKS